MGSERKDVDVEDSQDAVGQRVDGFVRIPHKHPVENGLILRPIFGKSFPASCGCVFSGPSSWTVAAWAVHAEKATVWTL
jgi:hypothetical protein